LSKQEKTKRPLSSVDGGDDVRALAAAIAAEPGETAVGVRSTKLTGPRSDAASVGRHREWSIAILNRD
jgi:hypothetical protein